MLEKFPPRNVQKGEEPFERRENDELATCYSWNYDS